MASLAKAWQLGKHVTSKSITPLTLDTDNVTFIPGTLVSLEGILDEFHYQSEGSNEDIHPMDSQRMNEVIELDGVSMGIREIVQKGVQPKLEAILLGYDYAKISWASGGKTYTFYGVRRPGAGVTYAHGKQVYQMEFGPVDIGGPNLTAA